MKKVGRPRATRLVLTIQIGLPLYSDEDYPRGFVCYAQRRAEMASAVDRDRFTGEDFETLAAVIRRELADLFEECALEEAHGIQVRFGLGVFKETT